MRKPGLWAVLPALLATRLLAAQTETPPRAFDIVVRGARVFHDSDSTWKTLDIGIRDGLIARLGSLRDSSADRIIDARGLLATPGFIDLHSHADDGRTNFNGLRSEDSRRREAPNLVTQGITTVVVNQDGRSPLPIATQIATLRKLKTGPNVIPLVGHGSVRARVLGGDYRRAATPQEIAAMRDLVRQAMREGAWGMSVGLEYLPGRYSDTEELVQLTEAIVPYNGVYIAHQRSEGRDPLWYTPSRRGATPPSLLDAVRETIEIGQRTRATVVASHIKVKGADYWGTGRKVIRLIDAARRSGVNIWADQYPYATTGGDGNSILIPFWVFRNGRLHHPKADFATALDFALENEKNLPSIRRDIAHEITRRGGADRLVIFAYPDSTLVGKTVSELADSLHLNPVDLIIRLQLDGFADRAGGARIRGFSLSEGDIESYMQQPWVATASDAGITLPGDGPVHARYYGTFTRRLKKYAIDSRIITLEHAIRSATTIPAAILRLKYRGAVREGFAADIVLMDLETVSDEATFMEPHRYSTGIEYVFVNGVPVVRHGQLTHARPGIVLSRNEEAE